MWRLAHPGYWRRKRPTTDALQDETLPQPTIAQVDSQLLQPDALQDLIFAQPAVIVGLISHLTGSALQDEIEVFTRKMQTRGQEILGMNPGIKTQGGLCYARKASVVFAGSANSTKAV